MSVQKSPRALEIRASLEQLSKDRITERLSKVRGTDSQADVKREKIREDLKLESLLDYGTSYAGQIQLATHILKGIHPDPKVKETTNLLVKPSSLNSGCVVGSHVLKDDVLPDTTGNGAHVTRIYELSLLVHARIGETTLLNLLKADDADAVAALGGTPEKAATRKEALATIDAPRCAAPASHTKAKQFYWLEKPYPHEDSAYHLLAPLYPTLLVHCIYEQLQDDRFSEEAKAARAARKNGIHHTRPVREYSDLAIQKLGGTKPHNISQLNSVRGGTNYLLASVPPLWKSVDVRPLFGVNSLFLVFGRRREVQQQVRALRQFLELKPLANADTRRKISAWLNDLLDELLQFSATLQTLPPGWSVSADCDLPAAHRLWLDPTGTGQDAPEFEAAADQVAEDFARWLNTRLRDPLPLGDAEFLHWRRLAIDQLRGFKQEVA